MKLNDEKQKTQNEHLAAWLSQRHGYLVFTVVWEGYDKYLSVRNARATGATTAHRSPLFQESRHNVALIEARLDEAQQRAYARALTDLFGSPECLSADDEIDWRFQCITASAARRVQALVQVLVAGAQ